MISLMTISLFRAGLFWASCVATVSLYHSRLPAGNTCHESRPGRRVSDTASRTLLDESMRKSRMSPPESAGKFTTKLMTAPGVTFPLRATLSLKLVVEARNRPEADCVVVGELFRSSIQSTWLSVLKCTSFSARPGAGGAGSARPGDPPLIVLARHTRQSSISLFSSASTRECPVPSGEIGHLPLSPYSSVHMMTPFLSVSVIFSPELLSAPAHGPKTRTPAGMVGYAVRVVASSAAERMIRSMARRKWAWDDAGLKSGKVKVMPSVNVQRAVSRGVLVMFQISMNSGLPLGG